MKRKLLSFLIFFNVFLTNAQDPVFKWAVQIGQTGSDEGRSMVIDDFGNIYTTGWFRNTVDFDPGSGVFNLTSAGSCDIFVQKLDSLGNLLWAKNMGGPTVDRGYSIALDNTGNVVITGKFSNTSDLDPSGAVFNVTASGSNDIFVVKLNSSGSFLWGQRMGGPYDDIGYSVAIDNNGNILTTGYFSGSANFGTGVGQTQLTSLGGSDVFIQKLSPSGNLIWVKSIQGSQNNLGYSITTDASGNVYTVGEYQGIANFNVGGASYNVSSLGGTEGYIHKSDSSGNFLWVKTLNSAGDNACFDVAIDGSGSVYTTGWYGADVDFDPGQDTVLLSSTAGSPDSFVEKSDSAGNLIWAKSLGGQGEDYGHSIVVDLQGNSFTTGYFEQTADFDPDTAICNLTSNGSLDIYMQKLGPSGDFKWAKQIGGGDYDVGYSISIDGKGNVYTIGLFSGTADANPERGLFNLTSAGSQDVVIQKMRECQLIETNISVNTCGNYLSPSGLSVWSTSGTYYDTLQNYHGCDSVVIVDLTINDNSLSSVTAVSCTNYLSPSGLSIWSTSGTYSDTLQSFNGCDSIITVDLTIGNSSTILDITACESYISPSNKYSWNTTGTYFDTLVSQNGCDSVLLINLTLTTINSNVEQKMNELTASADSTITTYQWLDCNNVFTPITGASDKIYVASENGTYAVELVQDGCSDTSSCYTVTTAGIELLVDRENVLLYPNPVNDKLNLAFHYNLTNASIEVIDLIGTVLIEKSNFTGNNVIFDMSGRSAGVYFVRISQSEQNSTFRFFKN